MPDILEPSLQSGGSPPPAAPPATTPPPPPAAAPPAPPAEKLLAGKYKSPDDLGKGVAEARKHLGLGDAPAGKPIIGDGGLYATVEQAELAYNDLQKLISRGAAKPAATPAADPKAPAMQVPDPSAPLPDDADITALLASVGLTRDQVWTQYTQHGILTDEQYAALRTKGVTRKMVNDHLAGEASLGREIQQVRSQAADLAGGQDQLDALLSFGSTLPAKMIASINARLADKDLCLAAVRELAAEHQQAVGAGKAQPLIQGGVAPAQASAGYDNATEYLAAARKVRKGIASASEIARFRNTTTAVVNSASM